MQEKSQATQAAEQQKAAEAQIQQEMQRMLSEVKKQMKPKSKNELIRIVGALLLDNYSLKVQLDEIYKAAQAVNDVQVNNDLEQTPEVAEKE